MSSDQLLRAATKLRETAADVPGVDDDATPWSAHFGHDGPGTDLCDEDTAWIALMDPAIAEPLATWLETTARQMDGPKCDDPTGCCNNCEVSEHFIDAIAVAFHIIGEASSE